ncbi:Alpha/Beta hydrolase protein [Lyophyllum atratum]|nr:Alpha/Beta hydrolase protein [Lyophyllum atratum]
MPHLNVNSPSGNINFHYNIATPTSPASPNIAPNLPTILFVHGEYFSQEVFEAQFSDPQLRTRFNLLAIDQRGFGSTGGFIPETYTPIHAAHEFYLLLKALDIRKIHIYAVSIGTHIALELAISHPDLVDSLTLCSTLPPKEPEETAGGRVEVYDFWKDSSAQDGSIEDFDPELMSTLIRGAQQLMYSGHSTPLSEAITMSAKTHASKNWAGTPAALVSTRTLSIDWFVQRRVFDVETLSKIGCPITIIHCEDDIVYPLRHAQEFETQLIEAGNARVTLCQVPGPRFANVIYPDVLNPIIRSQVLLITDPNGPSEMSDLEKTRASPFITPFRELLAQHGYHSDSDEDSE